MVEPRFRVLFTLSATPFESFESLRNRLRDRPSTGSGTVAPKGRYDVG
ncbi:MAG: hypothetical protein HYY32_03890 [Chloroflexi bacterium]|nr:hypothetical protein [Chloroflexota bacterium]